MGNLARNEFWDDPEYEILNREVVNMSPASSGHVSVVGAIHAMMFNHFRGKTCKPYVDGLTVHFSEKDKPVPDVMVICRPEIVQTNGVHGAPDLIVEVLSPSTAFRDKGYKKELYQNYGVREYWIADPKSCSIEVYQLIEGKYALIQVYVRHTPDELTLLTEKERKELPSAVQSCIFPDLAIPLDTIFEA